MDDPQITLPLRDFLDYLWGHKERSIVPLELARTVQQLDPQEVWTHIELGTSVIEGRPEEARHLTTGAKIGTIWRKKDWIGREEEYLAQKIASEKRVAEHNRRVELFARMKEALMNDDMGEEIAESLARKLMNNRNLMAIRALCGELGITEKDIEE